MTAQIMLNLPDRLFERVKSLAQNQDQGFAEAIEEYLDAHLPVVDAENTDAYPTLEQAAALDREKQAYLQMHPLLKQEYFGRFVAIYEGELIDVDDDFGTLYERVHARLPTQVVWMSRVEEEPIKTVVMRSPRFVNGRK